MTKRRFLLPLILFLVFLMTGCKDKDSAGKCLGEQITSIKEKDSEKLAFLLDKGIQESDRKYTLKFPEELKDTYLTFLQEALQTVRFQVSEAKRNGKDEFTVQVHYTPVDISSTTMDVSDAFVSSLSSSDLNAEASSLLEKAKKALKESPCFTKKTYTILTVNKTEDSFQVREEDLKKLLSRAIDTYMAPYDRICELLDARDFLTAYLDASFKGDVTRFALHTKQTEAEALAWYDSEAFLPAADLSSDHQKRYTAAMKELLKQCKYSVGIPKKEDGVYNYTVDVTVTPNKSLKDLLSEWKKGTYDSEDDVNQALVELLEKYAAAPTYGKETVVTIQLNSASLMNAGQDGAEITRLAREILPIP